MIIRATGKLAKQIGVSPVKALPLAENPFADWTCRVFSLEAGKVAMLITNTASLYSLLAPANGLDNRMQFGYGFIRYLERHLLEDGFGDIFNRHIAPELDVLVMTKALNRSVTGSMTDMVRLAEFMLLEDDHTLEEAAAKLNEVPFKALDRSHPRACFEALAT